MEKYIRMIGSDLIIYPCPNFNSGLVKLLLNVDMDG